MSDTPSTLLKWIAILLILIGMFGALSSVYAIRVVSGYDFDSIFLEKARVVRDIVGETKTSVETERGDVLSRIENTTANLDSASSSTRTSADSIAHASDSLRTSSRNLTVAASAMKAASSSDKSAARYLKEAAEGMQSWADNYDYNGTALPGRRDFITSVRKLSDSALKTEDAAKDEEIGGAAIENAAKDVALTSTRLNDTSAGLGNVSADLAEMRENVRKIGSSVDTLTSDVVDNLDTSLRDLNLVTEYGEKMKLALYAILGYFFFLNLLLIGIGASLLIVDVRLFYS